MELTHNDVKTKIKGLILKDQYSDEEFNKHALELFSYQYANNKAFRKFCRKRRVSPSHITSFTEVPPVPITAFKEAKLSCTPINDAKAVFMTSGTTNPEKRGKAYHSDLEIYNLSMGTFFKRSIVPDVSKIKMGILFLDKDELPNSSLAHYLHLAKEQFGTLDSEYLVTSEGILIEELELFLSEAEEKNEPVLLIGATFSFIHFIDYCQKERQSYKLPKGSRVMDTGGTKGLSRKMDPAQLRDELSQLLSIPEEACGNMYGMTELSSQLYDQMLSAFLIGQPSSHNMVSPPWVRTLIVDPETMQEKAEGEKGVIVHYDLANVNSVFAIMTEDVGIQQEHGFELLGRAEGSDAKGCSLVAEQFINAAGHRQP